MASDKASVLAELNRAVKDPRPGPSAPEGSPVVGYFCSYVPTEILLAAGLQPFRLRGANMEDTSTGDALLSHLNCSFCRHVVSAVLDGEYDFLSGQVSVNTCDHVRRAHDAMVAKSDLDFHGYIAAPRCFRDNLIEHFESELRKLVKALEDHYKVEITDDKLIDAAAAMNEVRRRMASLDELRAADEPRLSGSEALTAAVAARTLPPRRFLELADELIEAAETSDPIGDIRARVLLLGGELDEPRFVRTIESQGAHIAGDLLCYGTRGLGKSVEPGGKPLQALARSYVLQVPCARMMGEFPHYYQSMLELYDKTKARGIIFERIKFCQIWSSQVHNLKHRFETDPLPMLVLDREYGMVSTGQIKTRVQAFLEQLGV